MPTVFIPFTNFSLSRGRLNSGALVRADGVAHLGHGYAAPSPLFFASDPLDETDHEIDGPVERPAFAHMNPNINTSAFTGWLIHYLENRGANAEVYNIVDIGEPGPPWGVVHASDFTPLDAITDPEAGQFASFGSHTVLVLGHDQPSRIRLNNGNQFTLELFESDDKPRPKYASSIGERMLFANIANVGSAGGPDPNASLVWWGATDDARSIGNPVDNPEMASDFQFLSDDYGDISGLSGGKRAAYIFKHRGVYQMGLTNSLFGYGFDVISSGIGCIHSRSIVSQGDEVYFWSTLGPAVIRGGQVLLLGDGYWTERGLLQESPPHPNFKVLGAAADIHNGLILWHVQYDFHTYDYDGAAEPPTETVGTIETGDALIAYSYLSNQFTFPLRPQPTHDGSIESDPRIVDFTDPENPVVANWRLRAMVGGIPWDQRTMPLAGVGFIASEIQSPDTIPARLLASGFLDTTDDHSQPERIFEEPAYFATGMIQLSQDENVTVDSVRPIVRGRRARPVPTMRAWVRSSTTPFDVERIYGPFDSIGNYSARNGWIRTPGVAQGNFAAIDLEIASWSGVPWSKVEGEFAYWLEDIEGVEVQFKAGGSAR